MQKYHPSTGKITYNNARDSDGRVYGEGDLVAYNRGGTVTRGVVHHITPGGTVHIQNTSYREYWRDKISKVQNSADVLLIDPVQRQRLSSLRTDA